MDDLRTKQIEALEVAEPYCGKIANAIRNIMKEYSEDIKPDTEEYMQHISQGLNWIIQVFNGTKDLVNQNEVVIDKDHVNQYVTELNNADQANDNVKRVEALGGILEFVEAYQNRIKEIITEEK